MDSTDVSNAQQLRRQQLNSHVASGLAPAGGAAVRPTPAQATAPATAAVRPGEMPGMADPRAAAASQLPVRSPTDPLSLVAPHNFPPHHEPAPAATRPPERSVCKGCGAPKSGPGHGKIRGTATFAVHGKCTQPCKCGRSRAEHRLDPFGVLCKKQRKELAAQTAPPAAAAAPSASPTAAAAAAATAAAAAAATAATAAPVHPRPYVAGDSFHYALSPYLPSPPLPLRPPQLLLPPPLLQFALAPTKPATLSIMQLSPRPQLPLHSPQLHSPSQLYSQLYLLSPAL